MFKSKPAFNISIIIISTPKIHQIEIAVTEAQYKKMLRNLYKRLNIKHHFLSLAPDFGILNKIEAERITSLTFPGYQSSQPLMSKKEMLVSDAYNLVAKDEDVRAFSEDAKYLIQAFPQKVFKNKIKTSTIPEEDLPNTDDSIRISINSLRLFHV